MIELNNIIKSYNTKYSEQIILNNTNLKIEDNDYISIMGKSGSGKSTLLNIIGCISKVDSGEVIIDNKNITEMTTNQLDMIRKEFISFIFQNFQLIDQFTVFENIELPLLANKTGKKVRNKKINELMQRLNIFNVKDKFPAQISGGEQQRTAIARAVISDKKYILADEPTGALDGATSDILMDILDEENKNGKTIIVVTHDMDVAKRANHIVNLENGIIQNI